MGMGWLQRHYLSLEAPDLVLHIGAGRCAELEMYKRFDRSCIVLVEPQADLAGELAARTAETPHIRVISAAIAEEAGENTLHLFNLSQYASLHQPNGIFSLFPGLEEVGQVSVNCLTIADLISDSGVSPGADNWLVIDAPGAEAIVVQALGEDKNRELFSHVFLRAGNTPLFESVDAADQLLQQLHSLGYEQTGCVDDNDPEIPAYHLRLNRWAIEAARKSVELEQSVADREGELAELSGSIEQLQSELDESKEEARKERADLSIALRTQALRDADLKELQERYAAAIAVRDEQQQLLLTLRQRLGDAAEFLRLIDTNSGEGADLTQAGEIIRSLIGGEATEISDQSSHPGKAG